MTVRAKRDPFAHLRSAHDDRNQMHPMLAHALGLHRQRQDTAATSIPLWSPALDITERSDAYLVAIEIPGAKPDDLHVSLHDSLLTIHCDRRSAPDSPRQQLHRAERSHAAFRRSVSLPDHVVAAAIRATFEDGVLLIVVPKADAKHRQLRAEGTDDLVR